MRYIETKRKGPFSSFMNMCVFCDRARFPLSIFYKFSSSFTNIPFGILLLFFLGLY